MLSPANGLRFDANLSWLYGEVPAEERFDRAARDGFTAVEIGSSVYELPAKRIRGLLDSAGLTQILINTPAGEPGSATRRGAACVPGETPSFRAGVQRALEYATELGASFIHLMGGVCPDGVTRDHAFSTYVTNVAWAADQAAAADVTLVLEAINRRDEPTFILESVDQAADVVRAISHQNLRLLFDVYHCQVQSGDLAVRLGSLMPLIGHIQVADAPNRSTPGTGEIAWGFIFDRLRQLDYQGWIGLEYTPEGDTSAGLAWLRDPALTTFPAALRPGE